jgi:hypothetical protein
MCYLLREMTPSMALGERRGEPIERWVEFSRRDIWLNFQRTNDIIEKLINICSSSAHTSLFAAWP